MTSSITCKPKYKGSNKLTSAQFNRLLKATRKFKQEELQKFRFQFDNKTKRKRNEQIISQINKNGIVRNGKRLSVKSNCCPAWLPKKGRWKNLKKSDQNYIKKLRKKLCKFNLNFKTTMATKGGNPPHSSHSGTAHEGSAHSGTAHSGTAHEGANAPAGNVAQGANAAAGNVAEGANAAANNAASGAANAANNAAAGVANNAATGAADAANNAATAAVGSATAGATAAVGNVAGSATSAAGNAFNAVNNSGCDGTKMIVAGLIKMNISDIVLPIEEVCALIPDRLVDRIHTFGWQTLETIIGFIPIPEVEELVATPLEFITTYNLITDAARSLGLIVGASIELAAQQRAQQIVANKKALTIQGNKADKEAHDKAAREIGSKIKDLDLMHEEHVKGLGPPPKTASSTNSQPTNSGSSANSQPENTENKKLSQDEKNARKQAVKDCKPRLEVTNDEEEYDQCVKERTKYILKQKKTKSAADAEKAADEKLVRPECKAAMKDKKYESIKDCINEKVGKRKYARAECKKEGKKEDTEIENCIKKKIEGAEKQEEKRKRLQTEAESTAVGGYGFGGKKTKKKLNRKHKTRKRVFKSNKKGKKDKNTKKKLKKRVKRIKKTKKK